MDRSLREAERADAGGEATRLAIELLRAGRRDEALDRLACAWNEGDTKAARIFQEVLESSDPGERLRFAHHLDRLACAGLEEARTAWGRWFPEAGRILGGRMLSVREFLYQHARSSEPILLYGESGVGINLCAEVLHALRGEGALEREYVGAIALPLWEDALTRFESAPPGSNCVCVCDGR